MTERKTFACYLRCSRGHCSVVLGELVTPEGTISLGLVSPASSRDAVLDRADVAALHQALGEFLDKHPPPVA